MKITKQRTQQLYVALVMAAVSLQAYAGPGQKIRNAIDKIGTEMMVAGGGLLLVGIIIAAYNMFFGGQIAKKYLIGALCGGLLMMFATDIADFVTSLG